MKQEIEQAISLIENEIQILKSEIVSLSEEIKECTDSETRKTLFAEKKEVQADLDWAVNELTRLKNLEVPSENGNEEQ